ncbi:MAG: fumarate reductase subunit D [Phycisphaera sp.]|nr:fumarate reductase subunit D [Phycisphaera sp.]
MSEQHEHKKHNEAMWWFLFAQGGVMAALFIPALIVLTGFLVPTDHADTAEAHYNALRSMFGNVLVQLILLVVLSLTLFHCAHRIRHTLMDLGLKSPAIVPVLYIAAYGGAAVGTIISAYIVFGI